MNTPILLKRRIYYWKPLGKKKSPHLDSFTAGFYQTFKEEITAISSKKYRREDFPNYYMRLEY